MAVRSTNVHDALHTTQPRHWAALAMKNGGEPACRAMCELAGKVEATMGDLRRKLPATFPIKTFDAVAAGMRAQARRFRLGLRGMQ